MKTNYFERWFGGVLIADQIAGVARLFSWIFGIVLVVVLSAAGFTTLNSRSLEALSAYNQGVNTLNSEFLQVRRIESEYLERRAPAELDRHAARARQLREHTAALLDNAAATEQERTVLEKVRRDVDGYVAAFRKAAEAQPAAAPQPEGNGMEEARKLAQAVEAPLPGLLAGISARRETLASRVTVVRLSLVAFGLLVLFSGGALLLRTLGRLKQTAGSIQAGVAVLQSTVERVRAGEELKEGDGVQSQDEIGVVWRTVNTLLTERRDAQRKAERENEGLNDSVISILQSVNQLSQRDLTARAPVTQDIIGTVSDSINAMTDETAKVLRSVSLIAGQVAQASGNVRSQAALVSRTAEDERGSVDRMVESLAQATQTMNRVSDLAVQTNASAAQATQATDTALETVNGTVKGMESIRETIAETEKRIKRLGERSQEISGIVNLINTISERTHVLALNASMQAAVAGEAGRGFAVVAEEVQRLAESSRNATQQIATLVNNIQLETNETISTVNRTIGQVVDGSELAQKAGEQMRRTQEITGQLVAHVRNIGTASDEQKATSVNLLQAVQHIGESTQRTGQQIEAQNHETETLLQSASRLLESVNVFKLPKAA